MVRSTISTPVGADLRTVRLDLAGTRGFAAEGAGEARRAAITAATDSWLSEVFAAAVRGRRGLALAAVGSLGRQVPGPLSDLDLVLLHDGRSLRGSDLQEVADAIWYPVWDTGLRLDHSVRTVADCRRVADADLTAATGLLDLRLLAGDQDLVAAVRSTVAHDWRASARKHLPALLDLMTARHARFGELSQSLEPDLKEARGGLRDMTVLSALTQAWLTDRDHGPLDQAHRTLLDVRDAVHLSTGRGRDRLLRVDADAVAALLGHADSDALLTEVSTAARTIAWSLDSAVRRAGQSQRARTLRVGPRRPSMTPLGYGVFRHDDEAVLGSSQQIGSDAVLPLRAAVVAARSHLRLSPQTLRNLAQSPDLPDPWPEGALTHLTELLAAGPALVPAWEDLDQVGLVQRWIPEWGAVRSRPQRNAVHIHTVDRHLLETVVRASARARDVRRPDLLLLAALLHDIGKIAGAHDHSETGARIAARIGARLGLSEQDAGTLELLVREHLTLVELATRRDLQDPATIRAAVDTVRGERETFELLLALTIADAQAAGPTTWTDWRATLLTALADTVRAELDAGPAAPPSPQPPVCLPQAAQDRTGQGHPFVTVDPAGDGWTVTVYDRDRPALFADTAGVLAAHGLTVRSARLRTEDGIAADTWVVDSPGGDAPEPSRITAGLTRLAGGDRSALGSLHRRLGRARRSSAAGPSRAFVLPGSSARATVLEVRAEDRAGLLHDLGRCLAQEGLDVLSAHISTRAGQAVDTFYVVGAEGAPLTPGRVAQVLAALIDTCDPPG